MAGLLSQTELDAFRTLGDVLTWAGVDGTDGDRSTLLGAFLGATGASVAALPRMFGVIPKADFDAVINAVEMVAGTADQPIRTPPNLIQRGALISVGYACRLKTGLLESLPAAAVTAPPANALQVATPAPANRVKMSLVLKQGDDTEVEIVSDRTIADGHARWDRLYGSGSRPSPDVEASEAQLSCLKHLVDSGQVPVVDFAVWGPHGNRIERKLRLTGAVFAPDGSLRNIEIAGPPTIDVWLSAWEVFSTACIMLDVFDLGTLLSYKDHILRLHSRYGPQVWLLLYQADTRFRSEHLVRTRRRLAEMHERALTTGGTTPYEPTRPWSFALAEAIKDGVWWHLEFSEAAMMILARTSSIQAVVAGDAPVTNARSQALATADHKEPFHSVDKLKRKREPKQDNSKHANNEYTHNRKGDKICAAFQTGACGNSVQGILCPKDRECVHLCSKCLDNRHGAARCPNSFRPPFTKKPKGNQGKGKGKGKAAHW